MGGNEKTTTNQAPITLELGCLVNGANLTLRTEVKEKEQLGAVIKQLSEELKKAVGVASIAEVASLAPAIPTQLEVAPSPNLLGNVPELAILQNAPNTYAASDAALEVLNPQTSVWAKQAHTVREVQERLMQLGVMGVSNIQNFDRTMRSLQAQGKVRREKVEGVYKYYLVRGGVQ